MQLKFLLPSLLALAVASVPALAEEIVYFTNGSSMAVEAYSIEDGTIRLDLGDQAFVAFPVEQIDRIETIEGEVRRPDSIQANKIVKSRSGSVPPRPHRQWQGGYAGGSRRNAQTAIETDRNGIAIYRPYANNPAPNKRQFSTVSGGSRNPTSSASPSGIIGTSRLGSRLTLPSEGTQPKMPVGLSAVLDKPYKGRTQNKDKNDEKK